MNRAKDGLQSLSIVVYDWFENASGREKARYEAILKTLDKIKEEIDIERCGKCHGLLQDHNGIRKNGGFICPDCALKEI